MLEIASPFAYVQVYDPGNQGAEYVYRLDQLPVVAVASPCPDLFSAF